MFALYISFFLFICLLSYSLIGMRAEKKYYLQKRIHAYFVINMPEHMQKEKIEEEASFYERLVQPIWTSFKQKYNKRLGKEETSKLENKLLQAGQPFGFSPVEFKIMQTSMVFVFPLLGIIYSWLTGVGSLIMFVIAVTGIMVAIILPRYYLKIKIQKRGVRAGKELPDILDLLTISLEAGLGFDAALSQVIAKKKGEVVKEFKVCLDEMRLGKTRKEALTAINERLLSEELRSLIYNIVQAEKLGIGMVSVLRVQTEEIREQRKQKAEEKAMKAPIKMMFPLVLFIFPTLFIILLGPAILQLIGSF